MNASVVIMEMIQLTKPGMPTTWIGRIKDGPYAGKWRQSKTAKGVADYFLHDFPVIERLEAVVQPVSPAYHKHCREMGTEPWPRNYPPVSDRVFRRG